MANKGLRKRIYANLNIGPGGCMCPCCVWWGKKPKNKRLVGKLIRTIEKRRIRKHIEKELLDVS